MPTDRPRSRRLRSDEKSIIAEMIRDLPPESAILRSLEDAAVEAMNDGGMGSLRFVRLSSDKPRFKRQIREATFADSNGVSVSMTINLDQDDCLFELDIFKADFSPLKRFPALGDISLR